MSSRIQMGRWPAGLILFLTGIQPLPAAPLTFNSALPVAKGELVARVQYVRRQSGDDPSGLGRDRTTQSMVTVLGYGVGRKLALFAVLPIADNRLDLSVSGERIERSGSGFGDARLFGRYTAYQRDWRGRTLRVAPLAGIKAPTGSDAETDDLGRLPPSVQPGSGSWDVFGGVVATYQTLAYQLDGQIAYRVNTEANDFRAGNTLRLDGSFQYRLRPVELTDGVPHFLYGAIEVGLVSRDNDEIGGNANPDSGGTTLFLTPALQYVTKRWIAEGGISVPIAQDLNGAALENDYVARAGLRFNF